MTVYSELTPGTLGRSVTRPVSGWHTPRIDGESRDHSHIPAGSTRPRQKLPGEFCRASIERILCGCRPKRRSQADAGTAVSGRSARCRQAAFHRWADQATRRPRARTDRRATRPPRRASAPAGRCVGMSNEKRPRRGALAVIQTAADDIPRASGGATGLVAPCRLQAGIWCPLCAQEDPYGDGRPAAAAPGEVVRTEVALPPDPRCTACVLDGRCTCLPLPTLTLGGVS